MVLFSCLVDAKFCMFRGLAVRPLPNVTHPLDIIGFLGSPSAFLLRHCLDCWSYCRLVSFIIIVSRKISTSNVHGGHIAFYVFLIFDSMFIGRKKTICCFECRTGEFPWMQRVEGGKLVVVDGHWKDQGEGHAVAHGLYLSATRYMLLCLLD